MWTELESMDVGILDEDVVKSFEYQGFNPNLILKSLLKRMKSEKISKATFLKDISTVCAIAIIKGSITDRNLGKMSDAGKARYGELETRYGLVRGGGKGKSGEVVTVARMAAAFPGVVVELLQSKRVPSRSFIGDLKTQNLPGVLKHQALAACIPQSLPDRSKDFLLGLITAYSVDQTRVISKTKKDLSTLLEEQIQYTRVAHGGGYPSEEKRVAIIKRYNWNEMFAQIILVANHIKTKWPDFNTITQQEFSADLAKV